MLAQYGVAARRPARGVAERVRRRRDARTPRRGRRRSPASPRSSASGSPGSSPRTPRSPGGRSMIIMGAGICQWFHGDATYRAILALLILTGCMGRNGGGWAHYVGQEKCRPITGWISLANALDWTRPPRTMTGTSYWYMHTGPVAQRRLLGRLARLAAGRGPPGRHAHGGRDRAVGAARLDAVLPAVRPRTRCDVADDAQAAVDEGAAAEPRRVRRERPAGRQPRGRPSRTSTRRRTGRARWCCGARTCMGRSAKGNEYFLKHLLGTHSNVLGSENPRRRGRPRWPGATRRRRASSTCSSPPTSG